MGEWISNNILLPLMYFLVDIGLAFCFIIIAMTLLDKFMDSQLVNKIRRKIK